MTTRTTETREKAAAKIREVAHALPAGSVARCTLAEALTLLGIADENDAALPPDAPVTRAEREREIARVGLETGAAEGSPGTDAPTGYIDDVLGAVSNAIREAARTAPLAPPAPLSVTGEGALHCGDAGNGADSTEARAPLAPRQSEASERVESGPVQFGDDWPGVFLRGDEALSFGVALREYTDGVDRPSGARGILLAQVRGLAAALLSCEQGKRSPRVLGLAPVCGARCDHGSECLMLRGHGVRHETHHGCVFYTDRTALTEAVPPPRPEQPSAPSEVVREWAVRAWANLDVRHVQNRDEFEALILRIGPPPADDALRVAEAVKAAARDCYGIAESLTDCGDLLAHLDCELLISAARREAAAKGGAK